MATSKAGVAEEGWGDGVAFPNMMLGGGRCPPKYDVGRGGGGGGGGGGGKQSPPPAGAPP